MIKKIKIELIILGLLIFNIFLSSGIDQNTYKYLVSFFGQENNTYLYGFFKNITILGDSIWVFTLSVLIYILTLLFKKKKSHKTIIYLKNISLILFTSTLVSGFITQLIKHIIGRARPNHALNNNVYDFSFLNFESAYHSFPSGHTTTIFVVALVLSLITPKIRYFYIFFALIISLSRVYVGAHYMTDVVGGIVVAIIGFKITKIFYEKIIIKKNIYKEIKINLNFFYLSLIIFLISIIFLTIGSDFDIFLSKIFYENEQQFILQSYDIITVLARKFFLPIIIIYVLILPILTLYYPFEKIYFSYRFKPREIIFLWLSTMFNLIIVVNLLLKNLWGRARPNDITEMGGDFNFTPWFEISNNCLTNCSFVSGDASVGFSLVGLFFITKNYKYFSAGLLSGFFLGTIRMLEGGHFLSDILIAGFLILILYFFQYKIFMKFFNHAS